MNFDRRTLLIGGGVGVGLVVGFVLWPRPLDSELALNPGEHAFGNFIKIGADGRIVVAVPQVENGQGIWTALPQVVADELGAAWETVAVEPAPLTGAYFNAVAAEQGWADDLRVTAGSTSVRAFEQPMREAAAVARMMLVDVAAERWSVGAEECEAADGLVIGAGRTLGFGELAEEAAGRSPPRQPVLRAPSARRLMGQPLARLDGPAKSNGSLRFAADVRLPGLLFASARLAPPGGRLTSFDRDAAKAVAGVRHLAARNGHLAVVAENWWAAEQAVKAADPKFSGIPTVGVRTAFEQALANRDADEWFAHGDYEPAVRGSRPLAATYYVAPSLHLGLDPLCATARVSRNGIELWTPTLAPEAAQKHAQAAAGGQVRLYPMPVGDQSGEVLDANASHLAIHLARATGAPVQLILSQAAGQNHGHPSGGMLARMMAHPSPDGLIAAWKMRVAASNGFGSALAAVRGAAIPANMEPADLDGATPPYAIPNVAIDAVLAPLQFTAGYMRGSPQREYCFATESFVDELARRAGMEPLAFRMSMLGSNGRLARCLQGAARLAQWDGGGPGSTMGIAGCSAFGSHIALVATASLGTDQRIKVHRLVAAVDCGRVINSGLVRQQVEGAMLWALGQANIPAPEWIAGMPRSRAMRSMSVPRIADVSETLVQIIPSDEAPGGVSGLGVPVVAPAVANAIFAGTGRRLRELPFDTMSAA